MTNPIDPLAHLPDPSKRYQAFGIMRGTFPFIELTDVETGDGFILDLVTALELAGDINAEAVRLLDGVQEQQQDAGISVDPGTIDRDDPRWQQSLWRRPSEN